MTMIFAHRGFSGRYQENTMLAFQKVWEQTKADGIELDVQMTKDGELVIMHDETLDRTTNGSGILKDYTLAELKTLSVGINFKGVLPRQTIPTVREYLAWLKSTTLITNIELKTSIEPYPGIEDKLVALVKEYGVEKQVWFSSFNHLSIKRILELMPDAYCGLLTETWMLDYGKYCAEHGAATANVIRYYCQKPEFIQECHAHGIKVQAWTVNEVELMEELISKGVDVLITNHPDKATKLLQK